MQRNEASWKGWIEKNEPENFPTPEYHERLISEGGDLGPLMSSIFPKFFITFLKIRLLLIQIDV